jgi:hypothetical protein
MPAAKYHSAFREAHAGAGHRAARRRAAASRARAARQARLTNDSSGVGQQPDRAGEPPGERFECVQRSLAPAARVHAAREIRRQSRAAQPTAARSATPGPANSPSTPYATPARTRGVYAMQRRYGGGSIAYSCSGAPTSGRAPPGARRSARSMRASRQSAFDRPVHVAAQGTA